MITETDIAIYREIYYETEKPMIRAGLSESEIKAGIEYACEEYGYSVERYKALKIVDFIQRFEGQKISIEIDGVRLNHIQNDLPELRCPRRSEQPKTF